MVMVLGYCEEGESSLIIEHVFALAYRHHHYYLRQ